MMPYLDFDLDHDEVNAATFDEQTRYLAGRGIAARQDDTTGDDEFLHGDLIRSTITSRIASRRSSRSPASWGWCKAASSRRVGQVESPRPAAPIVQSSVLLPKSCWSRYARAP